MATAARTDVYTWFTSHIDKELDRGVRPWLQRWSAANAAGRIARPLRHDVQQYNGVNILSDDLGIGRDRRLSAATRCSV